MLHKFARYVAASTVLLILAGSFVTSTDSGLSVPDWPTTYGWNMFTFPPSKWVGGIFYEHGHRLIASTVGFLTIILAAWIWFADSRRWLRWFGVGALVSVVAQGILGGLTVIYLLPAPVSTAHAGLAEIFFCMTVAIALFTSPGWIEGYGDAGVEDRALRRVATTSTVVIFTQILVGAAMVFATSLYVWRRHQDRPELARPATLIMFLVIVQVTLGALTVISRRDPLVNSLHVVVGALVLTTSLLLTLRSWRVRFAAQRPEPQSSQSTQSDKHVVSAASARSAVKRGEARA